MAYCNPLGGLGQLLAAKWRIANGLNRPPRTDPGPKVLWGAIADLRGEPGYDIDYSSMSWLG